MNTTEFNSGVVTIGWGEGLDCPDFSAAIGVTDPSVEPALAQTGCPGIEFCENNISVGGLNLAARGLAKPVSSNCLPCVGRQENSHAS